MTEKNESPERITVARMVGTGRRDVMGPERNMSMGYVDAVEYIRADLAAPSAPTEVEGLVELRRAADEADGDPARYPRRGIIDRYHSAVVAAYESGDLIAAAALTAQQAEIERLREALLEISKDLDKPEPGLTDFGERQHYLHAACRLRDMALRRQLAEAQASAAAAYERAAHLIECDGDAMGGKNGAASAIRALATEAETDALAEIVKKAVDDETRACAQICDSNDQVGGWVSRDAILARLDQRKEATP